MMLNCVAYPIGLVVILLIAFNVIVLKNEEQKIKKNSCIKDSDNMR